MKISFFTPPLTQLNTPYPATAYLTGYLRGKGYEVAQHDLGIELIHLIYTKEFLSQLFTETENLKMSKKTRRVFASHPTYIACVENVIRFLSGKDLSLSERIANRTLLPEGPRFDNIGDLEWAFGTSGTVDAANTSRHYSSKTSRTTSEKPPTSTSTSPNMRSTSPITLQPSTTSSKS